MTVIPAPLTAILDALDANPGDEAQWREFWNHIARSGPASNDPRFLNTVAAALRRDGAHRILAEREAQFLAAAMLQRRHMAGTALSTFVLGPLDPVGEAERSLLLAHLRFGATTHHDLEVFITRLRRELLDLVLAGDMLAEHPRFTETASALACHCFQHEYVFAESDDETDALERLRHRVQMGDGPSIAMLAAYLPLSAEPAAAKAAERLGSDESTRQLVELQVHAPRAEDATQIDTIGAIADATSQRVRAQYEESPYPRWQYLPVTPADALTQPGLPVNVLVAGCGTGRHPLVIATLLPQAHVTAVDLSRASLAYAQRMAKNYGIKNARFVQGDLLQLDASMERFDLISCEGVLHHMHDPAAGLAVLAGLLAPGGRLDIAVYARVGGEAIAAGIKLREQLDLGATVADIKRFRQVVYGLPKTDVAAGLVVYRDFFFTSECRDLVFHIQDHRFSLPHLAEMIAACGLRVRELTVPGAYVPRFTERFPAADPYTDLAGWAEIERDSPGIFGAMYKAALERVSL